MRHSRAEMACSGAFEGLLALRPGSIPANPGKHAKQRVRALGQAT